jgi:isoleucyl-tRNA synthetase
VDFAALGGDVVTQHPLCKLGYGFDVPLLEGDHVTDEDGTGFVHTAPGHGREDFRHLDGQGRGACRARHRHHHPFTVDGDGRSTKDAPGFEGKRVIDDKGNKGDANQAVIDALTKASALIARGRLKHQYPHSWRLEEAGDLPQYAAVVHRHGQAAAHAGRRQSDPARDSAEGHRRDRVRAGGRARTGCAA